MSDTMINPNVGIRYKPERKVGRVPDFAAFVIIRLSDGAVLGYVGDEDARDRMLDVLGDGCAEAVAVNAGKRKESKQ